MASTIRVVSRWSSSPRSGTVSCSDSTPRATKKAATWLPLPCTIRPLAVSNSTLIPSLPASDPDGHRHVIDLGIPVVLVQVGPLNGDALDRRIGRQIDPSTQGLSHRLG